MIVSTSSQILCDNGLMHVKQKVGIQECDRDPHFYPEAAVGAFPVSVQHGLT